MENKNERIKELLQCIRNEEISLALLEILDPDSETENKEFTKGFTSGVHWADSHPQGFINKEAYVNGIKKHRNITNEEFIEMLKAFPLDAIISVECCNPRTMIYDQENNLIRID